MKNRIPLVQTQDRNINQLQSNINSSMAPLLQNPLLNGNLVQGVRLVSGPNFVNHGLGRNLIGWVVTRRKGPATVYDLQDANTQPDKTLALTASAAVEVDIYVF